MILARLVGLSLLANFVALGADVTGLATDGVSVPLQMVPINLWSVGKNRPILSIPHGVGRFKFSGLEPGTYILTIGSLLLRPQFEMIHIGDKDATIDVGRMDGFDLPICFALEVDCGPDEGGLAEAHVTITDVCDALEHHASYGWVVVLGVPSLSGDGTPAVASDCATGPLVEGFRLMNAITIRADRNKHPIGKVPIPGFERQLAEQVAALRKSGVLPRGKILAVYGYLSAFEGLTSRLCAPRDCSPDLLLPPAEIMEFGTRTIR